MLIDELKQHALMAANEIKRQARNGDEVVALAYERAKLLDAAICPSCWVRKGDRSELELEASATESNIYKCGKCEFFSALPKN